MAEVSLMIASYNDPCGLYLSTFAALEQLEKSDLTWEIVLTCDGGTPSKFERAHPNIKCLRYGGGNRLGSPQATRDAGIRGCQYRNVLCVDSHVIVSDIQKWVSEHEKTGAAISFPAMVGGSHEMWKMYGSEFDWDNSFWYTHVLYQPKSQEPYRILQTSHSGFMIDRDFYVQSGGYTNLQVGYGGEETFLGLKAWMLGRENWMIPQVWHAHFQPANRNEAADTTPNYKRNFLVAAYVFGGEKYLRSAERHYGCGLQITGDIEAERQRICAGPFHGNLDALREKCKREGIVQ